MSLMLMLLRCRPPAALLSRALHTSTSLGAAGGELDLVANTYLKHIRDLTGRKDLLEGSPEIKKQLEEQFNRLATKFHLPSADVVTKLNVQFEQSNVLSSVDEVTEGKPVDALIKELGEGRAKYEAEQTEKQRLEADKPKDATEASDYANDFWPIPPPHIEAQLAAKSA